MKQKFLWGGAGVLIVATAMTYFAADFALRNPTSILVRYAVVAVMSGLNINPLSDGAVITGADKPHCDADSGYPGSSDICDPSEETIEPIQVEPLPTIEPPIFDVEESEWPRIRFHVYDGMTVEPVDETPKRMPYAHETTTEQEEEFGCEFSNQSCPFGRCTNQPVTEQGYEESEQLIDPINPTNLWRRPDGSSPCCPGKRCEATESEQPQECVVEWQNTVEMMPDASGGEDMVPCVRGTLYLLGACGTPVCCDGSVTIKLYDDGPTPSYLSVRAGEGEGEDEIQGEAVLVQEWQIDKDALRKCLNKDAFGYGYLLNLPTDRAPQNLSAVSLTVEFTPEQGKPVKATANGMQFWID